MKNLLLQVFEWDIKITGWGDTGSWTTSMVSLPTWNSRLEFFFARFWKIITLRVFLEFTSNIQELQKEDSVCRQFCNPILDRDIIIKSSAYKSEFNLVPSGRMIGSDKVFWNAEGESLTYKLKSKGLKIQSWCTPIDPWNSHGNKDGRCFC